jgi:uncharacterized GH25 family protein
MKKIILCLTLVLSVFFASAHAVWIETNSKGVKNKAQEVSVFLGEFADNERDSVAKWFSNMKDVKLFVSGPGISNQEIKLTEAVNRLVGNFTPTADGVYTLSISHTVADIYGENKIEYYATAVVTVGKEASFAAAGKKLDVISSLETAKAKQPISIKVAFDKQPAAAKVVIISPEGWENTLYSNEKGEVNFTPIQTGTHMLEAVKNDKTASGTHNGKSFKSVTHLVTHCITVRS